MIHNYFNKEHFNGKNSYYYLQGVGVSYEYQQAVRLGIGRLSSKEKISIYSK